MERQVVGFVLFSFSRHRLNPSNQLRMSQHLTAPPLSSPFFFSGHYEKHAGAGDETYSKSTARPNKPTDSIITPMPRSPRIPLPTPANSSIASFDTGSPSAGECDFLSRHRASHDHVMSQLQDCPHLCDSVPFSFLMPALPAPALAQFGEFSGKTSQHLQLDHTLFSNSVPSSHLSLIGFDLHDTPIPTREDMPSFHSRSRTWDLADILDDFAHLPTLPLLPSIDPEVVLLPSSEFLGLDDAPTVYNLSSDAAPHEYSEAPWPPDPNHTRNTWMHVFPSLHPTAAAASHGGVQVVHMSDTELIRQFLFSPLAEDASPAAPADADERTATDDELARALAGDAGCAAEGLAGEVDAARANHSDKGQFCRDGGEGSRDRVEMVRRMRPGPKRTHSDVSSVSSVPFSLESLSSSSSPSSPSLGSEYQAPVVRVGARRAMQRGAVAAEATVMLPSKGGDSSSALSSMGSISSTRGNIGPSGTGPLSDSIGVGMKGKDSVPASLVCSVCGRGPFSSGGNLRIHMKQHDQTATFTCKFCDKFFARIQDLRRHESSHGNSRFECKVNFSKQGGKGRSYQPQLTLSNILHFVQNCGTSFTRGDALKRHIKNMICKK
ncbi:hypothetical protein BC830DRAFT_1095953, partial [Chytriomyces sp. MP71]